MDATTKIWKYRLDGLVIDVSYYNNSWQYYIYLNADNSIFPPETMIKEVSDKCNDAGEFHCGVTYCERIKHQHCDDPKERWQKDFSFFKVGCDYNHYWDEGHYYDLDSVLNDAKNTIKKLKENKIIKETL